MSPTFRALHVRNYRLYASGQLLSNTGTWMQRVAQDWLVLSLTNGSGVALGITTGLQFLPFLLFSLWGGWLADRVRRRKFLVFTQAAMGAQGIILGVLAITGLVTVGQVYLFAFLLGVVSAVDNPTRQAFVGEMVRSDDLPNAVALNSASFNLGRILGPALAGLLVAAIGTGPVFLLNGLSYLATIAALVAMRPAEFVRHKGLGEKAAVRLRDGLSYVRHRADLILVLVIVAGVGTLGFNFQVTLALMARQEFHRGAAEFGLLSTALAVGSLSGSLLAARRGIPSLRMVVVSAALFAAVEVGVGLMPTFAMFLVTLPLAGVLALTFSNSAQSYLQLHSAPSVRGRVMGIYMLVFFGGTPFGAPFLGWLADNFGPRWGLIGGGLATGLVTVVASALLVGPVRRATHLVVEQQPAPSSPVEAAAV